MSRRQRACFLAKRIAWRRMLMRVERPALDDAQSFRSNIANKPVPVEH